MKKYLLAAASSLILAGSGAVWAADATVIVSGGSAPGSTTYTLNSLTMDANGNVTLSVTATGGGGNPPPTPTTKTLTVNQPANGVIRLNGNTAPATSSYTCTTGVDCPTVTLTAEPASGYTISSWSGAACGTSATCTVTMNSSVAIGVNLTQSNPGIPGNCPSVAGVRVIETPLTSAQFARIPAGYAPSPNEIFAFKMTTPNDSSSKIGGVSIAVGGLASSNNWVVFSECPGDIDSSNKAVSCYRYVIEAGTLNYAVNRPDLANRPQYCPLQSGKTYYVNVAKRTSSTSATTCTSPTSCSFYFSGY
ncbi:MAG: hypothetical protein AB7L76_21345 [Burkholderiaceae bacterium]